jgi:hypothetical protein
MTVAVAHKILSALVSYAQARGLDEQQVAEKFDKFDRALLTWIPSRHLTSVKFEIYDPNEPVNGKAIERFDLQFDIRPLSDLSPEERRTVKSQYFDLQVNIQFDIRALSDLSPEERRTVENQRFDDNIDKMMRRINDLGPLPDGVRYRIIFGKRSENSRGLEPPDVPGFNPTSSRSVDHLDTEMSNEPTVYSGNNTVDEVFHR